MSKKVFAIARRDVFVNGCLRGYVEATFEQLVALLGKPDKFPGDKTTTEWTFHTTCGVEVSVYDWKTISRPIGKYRWHIGGSPEAVDVVRQLIGCHSIAFVVP